MWEVCLGLILLRVMNLPNMLVPNKNYCLFEDWFMPILDQMYATAHCIHR